jgi:hypothetical protein
LEECAHSCKVFRSALLVCEAFISAGLGVISASLGNAIHAYRNFLSFRHIQKV